MSTYKTDLVDRQNGVGKDLLPAEAYGKLRVFPAEFKAPASGGAAGDVVELARIPKGARILPESYLYFEAGQNATLTVKVGDADDDDRYMVEVAGGTAAVKKTFDALLLGGGYITEKETVITMTGGTAAFAAGKKIRSNIYVVVD